MEREPGEYEDGDIEDLDSYIEFMYDDRMTRKIEGAQKILLLCLIPENQEIMISHDSLFGVISRTLRDEYKRNADISLYLLAVFYAFSNYTQFHPYLVQHQIGDTTMKIVDYQIRRATLRLQEMQKKIEKFKTSEDKSETKRLELDVEKKKFQIMLKKQDKMLCLCFQILLNLADNIQIERKMKKRKIVTYLIKMLERNNIFLLLVSVTFLKKLSIFAENKEEMKEENIIPKLKRILSCQHQALKQLTLRLLFNLSFEVDCRAEMDKNGLIPTFVDLLKLPPFRALILRILYHLSMDDRTKATFTYTDCLPLVYQLIIHFPDQIVGIELVALGINLTTNARNAEIMGEGDQFNVLIKRALQYQDVLLFKIVRNIAQFATDSVQDILEKYALELLKIAKKTNNTDFQVELLGTLVYTHLDNWEEVLATTQFLEFLQTHMLVGYAEDDVILECVMLIGTVCMDEDCAEMIANSYVIKVLAELITTKEEDDEIVLQILFTFHKLLAFKPTRDIIIKEGEIVSLIVELIGDKNLPIKKEVTAIMEIISHYDQRWKNITLQKKYFLHNQVYLQIVEEYEQRLAMDQENAFDFYGKQFYMNGDNDMDNEIQWYDGNDLADRAWDKEEENELQF